MPKIIGHHLCTFPYVKSIATFALTFFGYIILVLASVYSHCLANLIKMLGNTMPKPYSLQILNQWLHQCTSLLYKAIKNCLNLNKLASTVTFKSCLSFYFAPLKSECLFCLWQNLLKEKKRVQSCCANKLGTLRRFEKARKEWRCTG